MDAGVSRTSQTAPDRGRRAPSPRAPLVTSWAVALLVLALVRFVPPVFAWLLGPVVLSGEYGLGVAAAAAGVALWAVLARPRRWGAAGLALVAMAVGAWPAVQARAALRAGGAAVAALPATAGPRPPRAEAVVDDSTRYAAGDGTSLTLRRFHPERDAGSGRTPGPHPTLVVLYAGAWRTGDAGQSAGVHRALARRGYTVVALDYRHAPAHRFPAQLDDVRRGLALVRDSAAAWGVDTGRVVLWGRSSGGHLALLAALGAAPVPGLRIRGVVAFYGPTNLAEGYRRTPRPDPIGVRGVLTGFLGGAPGQMPGRYAAASPVTSARAGLPPALLVYGGRDHVVEPRFGREMAAALRRAGSPVAYVELPWAEHGFDFARGGAGARVGNALVGRFLARVQ
jgi:acetyl esterase/lipase